MNRKLKTLLNALFVFFCSAQGIFSLPIDLEENWEFKLSRDTKTGTGEWKQITKLPIKVHYSEDIFREGEDFTYITLKKTIHLSDSDLSAGNYHGLSLHIPYIASYYEVYWNGYLLDQNGKVENNQLEKAIVRRHLVLPIPHSELRLGENELRVVVAGHRGYNIDIWPSMNNEPFTLDKYSIHSGILSERVTLMLCFLYLFIGVYHFLFFFKRPQEDYNLYYALFAGLLAIYIYTRSNAVFELDLDGILLKKIEFSILYPIPGFLIAFLDRFFLGRVSLPSKIYLGFAGLLAVLTAFGSGGTIDLFLKIWQFSSVYIFSHSAVVSIYAYRKKVPDIKRLILGILVLMVCGIWDILGAMRLMGLQNLGLMRFGFFTFVMGIAFILANRFLRIHHEVEELNANLEKKVEKRTSELQESLQEIQALKVQQDGDYFLTSLLINPLTRNAVGSNLDDYKVDFFTKQKKDFEFRNRKMEIGGDINIVDQLNLRGRDFIAFVNGDAMGKSIQGAGGALVLGVIFHSVVNRTKQKKESISKGPESWLKECYIELQSVFETFDGSMLISVVMGLIDIRSGYIFFINSEHPWTVLYRDGKAGFLENQLELRKIGTMGLESQFRIKTLQLEPNDVVYVGSDGRDDILFGYNESGDRIINEDENLFLKCVEEGEGKLEKTVDSILNKGELTDDFSLIRIEFRPDQGLTDSFRQEETERLEYLLSIAKSSMRDKDFVSASVNFGLAAEEFPHSLESYYYASLCYKYRKDFQEALNYGERLYLRDPEHLKNLINLADIYRYTGNFTRASILLTRIDELDPGNDKAIKIRELIDKAITQA